MSQDSQIVEALKHWKSSSVDLHAHLIQMLNNLPGPKDGLNGLAHFQKISEYFKKFRFETEEPLTQQEIREKANRHVEYPFWLQHEEAIQKQYAKIKRKTQQRIISNFQIQAQSLFQYVGINFGSEQNSKINTAIKMLAEKQNATNLRFWGKILTTSTDYYVIQGVAKKKKEPTISQGMQKYKQGANYYSFWVCHELISDNWYELPLVSPEQIRVSRMIKCIFTGRLGENVKSYPNFPGEQRHLLKCQLVRITHNCEIVPNGLYSRQEQNQQEVQFSEQFKMPQFNDLTNLQNWVHLNPYILGGGRTDYYKDPKLTEEQREEELAKLNESDPRIQRLKGINEDKPIQKLGLETAWVTKQVGNLQVFNGKEEGVSNVYGCVVLRNPHWPGWQTVANSQQFGSIYIGYGYKQTQQCFYPVSPQDIAVEGVQLQQIDEPNPRDPPDELEPDSDDENKKQENV